MDSPKLPMMALSLCPAIDTTLYLDGLRPVQELPVREEHSEAGGKGPNVAAALARLGIDCPCIALDRRGKRRRLSPAGPGGRGPLPAGAGGRPHPGEPLAGDPRRPVPGDAPGLFGRGGGPGAPWGGAAAGGAAGGLPLLPAASCRTGSPPGGLPPSVRRCGTGGCRSGWIRRWSPRRRCGASARW